MLAVVLPPIGYNSPRLQDALVRNIPIRWNIYVIRWP